MNNKKQSGFTLVEIAIVLVIIGLLLGGILKGQELINSARVRNMADQNSGIQAAYFGFIDRYRQVPGDWLTAGSQGATAAIGVTINTGGNGNGRIDNNLIEGA
ncbi:MAG: prepilin-type N-terminal cleavage/methylation domain-containing protein, partial [Gammaproteobacteria bacterium]|nr:prepilin-type N-terminal cleavage/methylation domain-containing protein [Gammaproteobacteria bacterium]